MRSVSGRVIGARRSEAELFRTGDRTGDLVLVRDSKVENDPYEIKLVRIVGSWKAWKNFLNFCETREVAAVDVETRMFPKFRGEKNVHHSTRERESQAIEVRLLGKHFAEMKDRWWLYRWEDCLDVQPPRLKGKTSEGVHGPRFFVASLLSS